MIQIILFSITFIALFLEAVTDIKTREVPDWINYGTIFAGIGIRTLYSSLTSDWIFLLYGLAGLGLFMGVLNMIPYLQLLGLAPTIILAIVKAIETNSGIWDMIGLTLLVFVIVQLIQDSLIVPKIMGNATGLSPVMILLSLSIWGKLLGMLGLLIALPMTCLSLTYYGRFLNKINSDDIKVKSF